MKMRVPAERRVVEAVMATFREPAKEARSLLAGLAERDWVRTYYWLDASGLALYLLERVEACRLSDALPAATLERLRRNRADNEERVETMFAEFASLNHALQHAGVDYANLKGFTLSPEWCADPALRRALDFDFLVEGRHLQFCRELLEYRGYRLTAATGRTWEFKAGATELARIENFYRGGPQQSVELHFASSTVSSLIQPAPCRDERLDRLVTKTWAGVSFPALGPADQFVAQALHLLGHLTSASTRPAWLLEYRHAVSARAGDEAFWDAVRERAGGQRDAALAIGLASLLATRLFGGSTPPALDAWTLARLPAGVRMWAERYGSQAVLADIPGTKLYLLLQRELQPGGAGAARRQRVSHLLPAPRAPRIVYTAAGDGLCTRLGKELEQARFVLFRARFHVVEGLRYLVEAWRWRRRMQELRRESAPAAIFSTREPREANE